MSNSINEFNTEVDKMQKFLKKAFCIDGDCTFKSIDKLEHTNKEVVVFSLQDSKRGEFYICIGKDLK